MSKFFKSSVEVWKVMDMSELPSVEVAIGTFPKIREFALTIFDNAVEERYQRTYLEKADEQFIFNYLDEFNYQVIHVCDVRIDEFNVNKLDYTTDI